jgi:Uma2 family endonuclease
MNAVTAKQFSIDEYHRLIESGFLQEDDRIELIKGELVQVAAKGFIHAACNGVLYRELSRLLLDKAAIRGQDPISLATDSEPEPDLLIARGVMEDYFARHPNPADTILIIEVSDSTLKYDRTTKLQIYAEAGIAHYWIVNLPDAQLEAYSQPYQQRGIYQTQQIYLPSQSIEIPELGDVLSLSNIFKPHSKGNS